MSANIKITHVGQTVNVELEKGTGTFELFLNELPTDEWRKLFGKIHSKDYSVTIKTTEQPACIEVTCHPDDVQEAAEAIKWAVQKSNEKLDDQIKKAERKALERDKALTELQEKMSRQLAQLKFD
jgi:hypothetical protein